METLSTTPRAAADRAVRIGRVKFVALPLEDEPAASQALATASWLHRLLQLLRHFASRVDGRPMAARP
ncbi:MAG TPA: hypothetical protein VN782_02170 [Usitatibacter sp.]|nr:hypothetical protein [Usitatibacter sp.]